MLTAFEYLDKGIGFVSKEQSMRDVFIWGSITKEEVSVLSTMILESGQRSQMVATLTRRVVRDYKKLQAGIIFIPRLVMTAQHLMTAGIRNPFGGN
jgi:hypothetical protein